MKKFILEGAVHHDGGHDADWSTPFEVTIEAKNKTEAIEKAREIAQTNLDAAKNGHTFKGFSCSLYAAPVATFVFQKAQAAVPAIKRKPAKKEGLVLV